MTALTRINDARGPLVARVPAGRSASAALITGAGALLVSAAIHLQQLTSIFHAVPGMGPLFAADAAASSAIALLLLLTRSRVAAAAGALVSAGALAGLALSSTVGLLGWVEAALRPPVVWAIAAEVVAVATLAPLAVPTPLVARAANRARTLAVVALIGVAGVHAAAAGEEWTDARGVFWMFVALIAASLAMAVRMAFGLDRWAWRAVLALAVLPTAGYVLTRTTGVPGDRGDVGAWVSAFGIAALALQAALAGLSLTMLWPSRRNARAGRTAALTS